MQFFNVESFFLIIWILFGFSFLRTDRLFWHSSSRSTDQELAFQLGHLPDSKMCIVGYKSNTRAWSAHDPTRALLASYYEDHRLRIIAQNAYLNTAAVQANRCAVRFPALTWRTLRLEKKLKKQKTKEVSSSNDVRMTLKNNQKMNHQKWVTKKWIVSRFRTFSWKFQLESLQVWTCQSGPTCSSAGISLRYRKARSRQPIHNL